MGPFIFNKYFLAFFQGAALASMAGFLTYGNKKFAPLDSKMREVLPCLYTAMKDLVPFVDHDAAAFSDYMVKTHTFSSPIS